MPKPIYHVNPYNLRVVTEYYGLVRVKDMAEIITEGAKRHVNANAA